MYYTYLSLKDAAASSAYGSMAPVDLAGPPGAESRGLIDWSRAASHELHGPAPAVGGSK
jgi:hypothetical protein